MNLLHHLATLQQVGLITTVSDEAEPAYAFRHGLIVESDRAEYLRASFRRTPAARRVLDG